MALPERNEHRHQNDFRPNINMILIYDSAMKEILISQKARLYFRISNISITIIMKT